jgi:hypothetical protein
VGSLLSSENLTDVFTIIIQNRQKGILSSYSPNTPEIPKEVAELYGILEGMDVPDKKELRRKFHEDHLN